jgi:hypothetical protein
VIDELRDPDIAADTYALTLVPAVALGRFREGRRLARAHDEAASRLTAHHRLHGVAIRVEVETLAGGWEAIAALKEQTEEAVEANLDTPCVRNVLSELLVSAACAYLGDAEESRRLEERAETIGYEEWQLPNVPRLRVALARGDLDAVERLLAKVAHPEGDTWFGLITRATRLDALAALRDARGAEAEAPAFLRGPPYLQAFALRALGVVREDESLLEEALARFQAMRLDWHAVETRKLLATNS